MFALTALYYNGTTDDTAALNAAITDAIATSLAIRSTIVVNGITAKLVYIRELELLILVQGLLGVSWFCYYN